MEETGAALGYLCPRCGRGAVIRRQLRDLAAVSGRGPCPCGDSALKSWVEGGALHLSVPCGLCGGVHHAVLPFDRLRQGDAALKCPESGQFCAFLGREEVVERRTLDLELAAAKDQNAQGEVFTDQVIMYEILSELRDIAARPGGITCGCGAKGCRMEVRRRSVDLICPACAARLRIAAATDRDLEDLCCQMRLRLPGRPPAGKGAAP